jgi:hypothetical protein
MLKRFNERVDKKPTGPKLVNIKKWEMSKMVKHFNSVIKDAKYMTIISTSTDGDKQCFTNLNTCELFYTLHRLSKQFLEE